MHYDDPEHFETKEQLEALTFEELRHLLRLKRLRSLGRNKDEIVELLDLLRTETASRTSTHTPPSSDDTSEIQMKEVRNELQSLSLTQLQARMYAEGLPSSGSKDELLDRLVRYRQVKASANAVVANPVAVGDVAAGLDGARSVLKDLMLYDLKNILHRQGLLPDLTSIDMKVVAIDALLAFALDANWSTSHRADITPPSARTLLQGLLTEDLLRDLLAKRGLARGGNKNDLIDRLLAPLHDDNGHRAARPRGLGSDFPSLRSAPNSLNQNDTTNRTEVSPPPAAQDSGMLEKLFKKHNGLETKTTAEQMLLAAAKVDAGISDAWIELSVLPTIYLRHLLQVKERTALNMQKEELLRRLVEHVKGITEAAEAAGIVHEGARNGTGGSISARPLVELLTVNQLRLFLQSKGLSPRGDKAALVERLLAYAHYVHKAFKRSSSNESFQALGASPAGTDDLHRGRLARKRLDVKELHHLGPEVWKRCGYDVAALKDVVRCINSGVSSDDRRPLAEGYKCWVYMYRHVRGSDDEFKIGAYVGKSLDEHLKRAWRNPCAESLELVHFREVKFSRAAESLIHTELTARGRAIDRAPCYVCGKKHTRWFRGAAVELKAVVDYWAEYVDRNKWLSKDCQWLVTFYRSDREEMPVQAAAVDAS